MKPPNACSNSQRSILATRTLSELDILRTIKPNKCRTLTFMFQWNTIDHHSLFYLLLYLDLYVLEDDTSIGKGSFMRTKHLRALTHIRIKGEVGTVNMFKTSSDFSMTVPRRCFYCGPFLLFIFHVCLKCYHVLSVPCSLVFTCWERAGLLTLLCVMFSRAFVIFPYGVSDKVSFLKSSIPGSSILLNFQ